MVLIRPCQKVYEQNFTFQYKILKFSSKSSILPTFTILNVLVQIKKWKVFHQVFHKQMKKTTMEKVFLPFSCYI